MMFTSRLVINQYRYGFAKLFRGLCSPSGSSSTQTTVGSIDLKLDDLEEKPAFPGSRSKWTSTLSFIRSENYEGIPVYRVMDREGKIIETDGDPNLGQEMITKLYKGIDLTLNGNGSL